MSYHQSPADPRNCIALGFMKLHLIMHSHFKWMWGGGPRVVVSTAAFLARVRVRFPVSAVSKK